MTSADRPPIDPTPKRTWWGRNWKWAVPVGCLAPILLCGGVLATLVGLVFGVLRSSDVYKESLARARGNQEVRALLGEPIEGGTWVGGNLETSGATGRADLSIPVSGPKGSATIHTVATKVDGRWEYS